MAQDTPLGFPAHTLPFRRGEFTTLLTVCAFGSTPDQDLKAAKYAVLTPGRAGFPNRAKRSEGSNSAPTRNAPVSPCEPLCAILLAKARVYPLSPVKTNVNRLCECDLKPLWKGLSPCRMGRTFSVFQADQAVSGGKQDSRRSLLKRTLRRLCRRC